MKLKETLEQTPVEETWNGITHGVGALLSVAALFILVRYSCQHSDLLRIVSFSIFGASLILLYFFSGLYHSVSSPKLKNVLHVFDHISIFLLISGTYTPFCLITLHGPWGWSIFGVLWGLTAIGIVIKIYSVGKHRYISTTIYVLMGWIILVAIKPFMQHIEIGGLWWLFAGGMFYTLGSGFYLAKRVPYSHVVWHFFVMGGSICHFFCMLFYVMPIKN